jgi:hypothetical protein
LTDLWKLVLIFQIKFKKYENKPDLPKIITPEICDSLVSTELSRNPWSSEENKSKKLNQIINKEKQNLEVILNFQKTFFDINNREPLETEIIDNLKDKIELSILTKSLEQIQKNKIVELSTKLNTNLDINSMV